MPNQNNPDQSRQQQGEKRSSGQTGRQSDENRKSSGGSERNR